MPRATDAAKRAGMMVAIAAMACGGDGGPLGPGVAPAARGALAVVVSTDPPDRSPTGYTLLVDFGGARHVAARDSVLVGGLADGLHRTTLSGVPLGCGPAEESSGSWSVAGDTVRAELRIACGEAARHGILFDDGDNVAFASADGAVLGVVAVNARGGRWSPDGSSILYASSGSPEVYVQPVDGGAAVQITNGGGSDPAWSPDGTRIAYANGGLWIANADGSDARQVTTEDDHQPVWAPGGGRLAFVRRQQDECTATFLGRMCVFSLNTIAVDGSGLLRLTASESASRPAWSPDGATIAYTAGGFLVMPGVRLVPATGGSGRWLPVSGELVPLTSPVWSPDGARLALAADVTPTNTLAGAELSIVPAGGGALQVLARLPGTQSPTSWR